MSHYIIELILKEKSRKQINDLYKQLEFNEHVFSLKHHLADVTRTPTRSSSSFSFMSKGNAERLAEHFSKNECVKRVTVTHVAETSCGVWRNGRKS